MTGKVVVLATAKGGAGKSTTIACLAAYWHRAGRRVGLIDADPNRTLTRWHAKGDALSQMTLRSAPGEHDLVPAANGLTADHDVVLIDCAGFNNQTLVFAIGVADFVLIPVMSDEANVFEALRAHKLVESASAMVRRAIPARTVMTRTKRAAVTEHARAQLQSLDARPLVANLGDRAIYQEATFHGSAPVYLDPASRAAQEIEQLAREIEPLVWPGAAAMAPADTLAAEPAAGGIGAGGHAIT